MTLSRLYELMETWRDYYQTNDVAKEMQLGYPVQSLVVQCGGGSSVDAFDEMCDAIDVKLALQVDALIDSLKFPQRDAIHHQWLGNAKCWPTHEIDYDEALDRLMILSEKRGMV
jgi:hypothetical protein